MTESSPLSPSWPSPRARHLAAILWPSFLMAGVMEMLVFAVVDPGSLQWFGLSPVAWSATAVYTVSFFLFWAVLATASGLTLLLGSHQATGTPGPAPIAAEAERPRPA